MICINQIPLAENTLKKIYLGGTLWDEFTYEYYNTKNESFGMYFNNILLVPLTKFIIHKLLMYGKITWTRKLINISMIWVFTYLLNILNYIEA